MNDTALPTPTPATYRGLFGWRTDIRFGDLYLALTGDTVAVSVPATAGRAPRVRDWLTILGCCGPIIATWDPNRWTFLADANGTVLSQRDMPPGLTLLKCPDSIRLPTAATADLHWIQPPEPSRRWLPTLPTIVEAARPGHWPGTWSYARKHKTLQIRRRWIKPSVHNQG